MESQWTLQKTSWNSSTVVYFGQRTIKTCILFPGLLSYDPKNLDNVSCCKMEVKNISSDNEIPDTLEGRTVATTLGLTHISNESLWKPKGTVCGPSGRGNHCHGLKFCLGYSVKIMTTKVVEVVGKTVNVHWVFHHYYHHHKRNWLLKVNIKHFWMQVFLDRICWCVFCIYRWFFKFLITKGVYVDYIS